jgi:hypothetical protein
MAKLPIARVPNCPVGGIFQKRWGRLEVFWGPSPAQRGCGEAGLCPCPRSLAHVHHVPCKKGLGLGENLARVLEVCPGPVGDDPEGLGHELPLVGMKNGAIWAQKKLPVSKGFGLGPELTNLGMVCCDGLGVHVVSDLVCLGLDGRGQYC